MIVTAGVLLFVALEQRAARRSVVATRRPPTVPTQPITLDGAATKGEPEAQVVLLLFSDFQCPFCAQFANETLPELERLFVRSGKLRIVFRHLPLSSIHPFARPAAESAWCAGQQNKFWDMHNQLFANPSRLDDRSIGLYARAIGLDVPAFERCRIDTLAQKQIEIDVTTARDFGVVSTPAVLLSVRLSNGNLQGVKWLTGALSAGAFRSEIDKVLAALAP